MAILNEKPLLLFCLNFVYIINILIKAAEPPQLNYCGLDTMYYPDSTYGTNLDETLASLPNTNSGYGFFNSTTGEGTDTANAIALCRVDVDPNSCKSCLDYCIVHLRDLCPIEREAILYYDVCFLMYSNATILGDIDLEKYVVHSCNPNNATDKEQFNEKLRPLMNSLRSKAASGGPLLKFAIDNAPGPELSTIHGLAQCIPSLSTQQCNDCLEAATNRIPVDCDGRVGARIDSSTCSIRFGLGELSINTTFIPPPPGPTEVTPTQGKNSSTNWMVIIIVVAIVIVVIIVSVYIFMVCRKKKNSVQKSEMTPDPSASTPYASSGPLLSHSDETKDIGHAESLHYNFRTVKEATNDFSKDNKLGQGGFGAVYKGKFQNGQEIAVKRLSKNSGQGEKEFKTEAKLVAKLQHRNLVRLLGFSLEGTERLLIYEFLPNASLDKFIFDPIKRTILDWDRRYKIIKGIARGLLYLHEDSRLMIIHRDMKASNVLLDAEMNPKIADFGLARLFNPEVTHVTTKDIIGSLGYASPEYVEHGKFSIKSDVFSFGVLMLEIITGQKNQFLQVRVGKKAEDLLIYAWKCWQGGNISDMIDPALKVGSGSLQEITRNVHIGLLCVQTNVRDRPTMGSVIHMLNNSSPPERVPSAPPFRHQRGLVGHEMPLEGQSSTTSG